MTQILKSKSSKLTCLHYFTINVPLFWIRPLYRSHRLQYSQTAGNKGLLPCASRLPWRCHFAEGDSILSADFNNQLPNHTRKNSICQCCCLNLNVPPLFRDIGDSCFWVPWNNKEIGDQTLEQVVSIVGQDDFGDTCGFRIFQHLTRGRPQRVFGKRKVPTWAQDCQVSRCQWRIRKIIRHVDTHVPLAWRIHINIMAWKGKNCDV